MSLSLKIDWATHAAAKFACENCYYSKSLPVGKLAKIGAWENGAFVGVVIFAWGSNKSLGSPYELKMTECAELVRIALKSHQAPVSKILSIALRFLRSQSPGLQLLVSFADPEAGHHGGIYQATNWIYSGKSSNSFEYRLNGKRLNKRGYTGKNFNGAPRREIPKNAVRVATVGKHRYLMPLTEALRKKLASLAKPYPKRAGSIVADAPAIHAGEGGSIPTPALHSQPDCG
jgi:hypothetical protein